MAAERLRPFIVPIFIPHQGCPHRCAFCEQSTITSQRPATVSKDFVVRQLEEGIRSKRFHRDLRPEVAFYGGTFTLLSLELTRELLGAVRPYLEGGLFSSIRVSTRPDAIEEERLRLLWRFGVRTIELGVQSMDEEVLALSRRGHGAEEVSAAVSLLKGQGFKVGVQLMPGLPGDSRERFSRTVGEIIRLRPDMARLYPAVVIKGTALNKWYQEGNYRPLELGEAVALCAEGCMRLESAEIPVIRIGLMDSPSLHREGQIAGGPWHPAFGFLVRSAIYHEGIEPYLPPRGLLERISIRVLGRETPLLRGYKNEGLRRIEGVTGARITGILSDDTIPPGRIEVRGEGA